MVNSTIIILVSILVFVLVVAFLILLFVYLHNKYGKIEEVPHNRPIVLNFTSQNENFLFLEIESKLTENQTRNNLVICRSFETQFDKDGNPIMPEKATQKQIITTKPDRRICFARGTLDIDREIILYFPESIEKIDDNFKNTKFFKLLEPIYRKNDALENSIHSFVIASERMKEVIDMLLSSNLDNTVVNKIKMMRNMLLEVEQTAKNTIEVNDDEGQIPPA
jgi:hypothetical protein